MEYTETLAVSGEAAGLVATATGKAHYPYKNVLLICTVLALPSMVVNRQRSWPMDLVKEDLEP